MSGNNMSRPIEQFEYPQEELYENVHEYAEELYLRKLIGHLEHARNMSIDLTAYPDKYTKTYDQDQEQNAMHVHIKSENLSFIRNQKHVHFDQFGQPYIRQLLPEPANLGLFDYSSDDDGYMMATEEEIEEDEQWQRDFREGRRELCGYSYW